MFLDDYVNLFPPGQVRVFMEAAACGLSQNPFLTVAEKQEHMEWFRQYFLNIEEDLVNNQIIEPGTLPDHRKYEVFCAMKNFQFLTSLFSNFNAWR